jgi:hypothetical protein
VRKKGDLQFRSMGPPDREGGGYYEGIALNTGGDPVANVGINDYGGESPSRQKVSWALANKEGRARAGPHMLLALMKEHYGLDPVADKTLTPEGARMTRSAVKRGLIKPHPENPHMIDTMSPLSMGSDEEAINLKLEENYADMGAHGGRYDHFNTGARIEAKNTIFPKRKK